MKQLQELQNKINDWSDKNFGRPSELTGTIEHLKEEVEHLKSNPYDPLALADVLILFLRVADLAGFDVTDLCLATEAKHTINQSRKWLEPDENGVIRHV